MKKIFSLFFLATIFFLMPVFWGCATVTSTNYRLMPSEENIDALPWKNYEEAENAFNKIEKGKTKVVELKNLGFDPEAKGVTVLDAFTIRDILLGANSSFRIENLPQTLQEYLKDLDDCIGFKFDGRFSTTTPRGDLFRRLLKFKRIDVDSTWSYEGWVFIEKSSGTIVYTRWIGRKPSDQVRTKKDPLGPLGDIFYSIPMKIIDAQ